MHVALPLLARRQLHGLLSSPRNLTLPVDGGSELLDPIDRTGAGVVAAVGLHAVAAAAAAAAAANVKLPL